MKDEVLIIKPGKYTSKGASLCNACRKIMPICWDIVCYKCGKTFCYDCSKVIEGYWYCNGCEILQRYKL